eukprot:CAMPEP_0203810880 /NCGR_PEP_ID=MMETSP0115-20131106/3216_1 /ASSEMBLY_ACC=CAM_ASM_000227 /TAXON_ID=33651 /ORGANISM="Bicosoecid sp, Strain ms1" /LENGTH=431 /DNA_ID=CAMNT_0050719685 /DNA_START=249 /DNA_END=1541 /DNA_ORIENTATION=-
MSDARTSAAAVVGDAHGGAGGEAAAAAAPADVFVRFRPLVGDEVDNGDAEMERLPPEDVKTGRAVGAGGGRAEEEKKGAAASPSPSPSPSPTDVRAVGLRGEQHGRAQVWRMGGFAGVLEACHSNEDLFAVALAPRLGAVLAGGTACVFAYGHTGSGKTHSLLGYRARGQAGLYQMAAAALLRDMAARCGAEAVLAVRLYELYGREVVDLMDGRAACAVREDASGVMRVRGPTVRRGEHGSRVEVRPPRSFIARSAEELAAAVDAAAALRRVGSSSLHDESSRSHAVLEMEVVTPALMAAREATVVALGEYTEAGHGCDGELRALMSRAYARQEDGSWQQVAEVDSAAVAAVEARRAAAKARYEAVEAREREAAAATPGAGGTLVCVDLAGSEFAEEGFAARAAAQSAAARKEAREINKSLLALKECIRAL